MIMFPTAKLTKRQKKGIAFRGQKRGKSKDKAPGIIDNLEDEVDVPSLEDQVIVDATQGQQGRQVSTEALVGKGKAGREAEAGTRKRKRKAGEEAKGTLESDGQKSKRSRGPDRSPLDDMEEPVEDHVGAGETGRESEKTQQRFILFLGTISLVGPSRSSLPPAR